MKKIGVIGSGTMGSGIIQTFAENGFEVQVLENHEPAREKARANIPKFIKKRAEKGQITQENAESSIQRIQWSTNIHDLKESEFIIEAIFENLDAKTSIFRELDQVTSPSVILATNSSSLSITRIAAVTRKPDRCIGMHFMNPVPLMPLVEIIRGHVTSDQTFV